MGFYNMTRFLKSFLLIFSRLFKYISISLVAICFIIVCLLLMTNNSKAETVQYTYKDIRNGSTIQAPEFTSPYPNRQHLFVYDGTNFYMYYPNFDGDYMSLGSNGWIRCGSAYRIWKVVNGQWAEQGGHIFGDIVNYSNTSFIIDFFGVLKDSNGDIVYDSSITFLAPVFLNAEDSAWGNTLTSGEFDYFFIQGNDAGNGSIPLRFTVIDISKINNDPSGFTEPYTNIFDLSPDSQYMYKVVDNQYYYAIPKESLTFGYLTDHSYKFSLTWLVDNETEGNNWNITTDFSSATILTDEQKRQIEMYQDVNQISQDVTEINNYLHDDSFESSTITDNMPDSSSYESPTDSGIENIFTTLRNTFTSSNTSSVVFEVPNSNGQTITIPADLVSSKLPSAIVTIIQGLYWFLICRFIVKDIAQTAEKAKSGDILDDTTDGNIKTDLL